MTMRTAVDGRVGRETRKMLGPRFDGTVLTPEHEAWDVARRVWNGMIDRHPGVIVQPRSAAAVGAAVRVARTQGLEIAVRCGGHSVSGGSTLDDGMVIDLGAEMRGVAVDPDARRVRVGGGARLADLDAATIVHGLATTGGMVSHTGVGGLTLGGGYGWLARVHGLACDNLAAVEMVTADGSIVRAGPGENEELLWGLRGGGGNFGIVTSFEFRLHPVPPRIALCDLYFRMEDAQHVLRRFFEVAASVPDELYLQAYTVTGRADHSLPSEHVGRQIVGVSWVWIGDPADGERAAAPFHRLATPIRTIRRDVDYVSLQKLADDNQAHGHRDAWKASFVPPLTEPAIDALLAQGDGGRFGCGAEVLSMGGAIARVGEDDTAYSHRRAPWDFLAVARWAEPAEDADWLASIRRCWSEVTAHGAEGVYVNNLGAEGQDRVRSAYGPAKYDRLSRLKRQWDPENVFHRNQNILPAPAG